ncbi:MAG: FecR family protein [Bacteroidales bacterium]|nr:FecR family protein [Bacteroidales bacterium]
MAKYSEKKVNWSLLSKCMAGECSSEENQFVTEWIKEDESHRIFYNELRILWNKIEGTILLEDISLDADWLEVKKRIHGGKIEELVPAKKKRTSSQVLLKYAAAIAFLIAASVLFMHFNRSNNLNITQSIESTYNVIEVPAGQKSKITFSDGSSAWINAESRISFPEIFSQDKREIYLEGEAFFEVITDPDHPFIVKTSNIDIKVTGTKFNVKSYPSDKIITTTLLEGKVFIISKDEKTQKAREIKLNPNQQARYVKKDNQLSVKDLKKKVEHSKNESNNSSIQILNNIDADKIVSWKDGRLIFEEETFESVAKMLERRYGVSVFIDNESLRALKYTGAFKNETIEQVMRALQLTEDFQYEIVENSIYIH